MIDVDGIVIDKPGKGRFGATDVDGILKAHGISQRVIAGVMQTLMHKANDRGYECPLVENAAASYFPPFKAATLATIGAQGAIVEWTSPLAAIRRAVA